MNNKNKIIMIVSTIFLFLILYIFLSNYYSNVEDNTTSEEILSNVEEYDEQLPRILYNFTEEGFLCLSLVKEDISICDNEENVDPQQCRDRFLWTTAYKNSDITLCQNIIENELRVICKALVENDITVCGEMKTIDLEPGISVADVELICKSWVGSDSNSCNSIVNDEIRDSCDDYPYLFEAIKTNNPKLCDNIKDSWDKLLCEGVISKNEFYCENIHETQIQ